MKARRLIGVAAAAALLLSGAACGNSGGSSGDKGTIQLSGQNFTEMQIMAEMYKQVLENAGFTVDVHLVATRDLYIKQLENGKIDIVPEYLGGIADYLNTVANGPNAKSITSNSAQASLAKLKPLASSVGISMLQPAKATDQNAFAVTRQFASQHQLSTLSDLASLGQPVVLAANPDCKGRSDCEGGLSNVYGINITKILPLGYDTPEVKNSLHSGESQLGEVATTDGALAQQGLVPLQDDKGIQPAQNLIPAVNSDFLKAHPDIASLLDKLSSTLTTADLGALNKKVGVDRVQASTAAHDYLSSKGLI